MAATLAQVMPAQQVMADLPETTLASLEVPALAVAKEAVSTLLLESARAQKPLAVRRQARSNHNPWANAEA